MTKYVILILFVILFVIFKIFSVETLQINRDKYAYVSVHLTIIENAYENISIDKTKFPYMHKLAKPYGISNYCGEQGPFFD